MIEFLNNVPDWVVVAVLIYIWIGLNYAIVVNKNLLVPRDAIKVLYPFLWPFHVTQAIISKVIF